jgi:protein tyrosine/serine phosphatase
MIKINKIIVSFMTLFVTISMSITAIQAQNNSVSIDDIRAKHVIKVDDDYYRGGNLKHKEDFNTLQQLGIKSIVDLRLISERKYLKLEQLSNEHDMTYYSLPMSPFRPPSETQVEFFLYVINDPANLPVYLHCTNGHDRTGIMSALYRVEKYGWGFDETYKEMKEAGYHPRLFRQQKKFLKLYIEKKEPAEKLNEN